MTAALHIVDPGTATTIQDLGRVGYQRFGVPVSGALDLVALAAANIVVGNPAESAALEIHYRGPTLEIQAASVRLAVAGTSAVLGIESADGRQRKIGPFESVTVFRGSRVKSIAGSQSPTAYLAVAGGFDLAPVLGSRATYRRARLGGLKGDLLKCGDLIELNLDSAPEGGEVILPDITLPVPTCIRIVPGPQDDHFTSKAVATFLQERYKVSVDSDRMGLRLQGPQLAHRAGYDISSDAIPPGGIQVPGDGQPVILLADRQTTGGYPKIATVISADIPALARLMPGAEITFERIGIDDAQRVRRRLFRNIALWPGQLVPIRKGPVIDHAALNGANLISGVSDGRAA